MRKKILSIISIFLILFLLYVYNKPVYGNSESEIIKSITQDENFPNKSSIKIFDTILIDKVKLVAFSYNDLTCLARFDEDKNGNYILNYKQWADSSLQTYTDLLVDLDSSTVVLFADTKNTIDKVKIEVLGKKSKSIEKSIEPNKAHIITVDIKDLITNHESYDLNFTYNEDSN